MGAIRVAVADDDRQMREVLTAMLLTDPRFDLAGEAGSGEELLAIVVRDRPDVALVDVRMPGGGTELVSTLRDGHAVVPVVVSSETSPTVAAAMLRAGARGFLTKGRLGASLPELVARCAEGEVVIASPSGSEVLRRLASADAGC